MSINFRLLAIPIVWQMATMQSSQLGEVSDTRGEL